MKVEVRRAATSDIPWLIEQLHAFEAFANFKRPIMDDEVRAGVQLADMIDKHVVLIAQEAGEGEPLGFISGYKTPHPFNPDITVLCETFWWVLEAARGSSAGAKLLLEFEAIGRAEADSIILSLEHNSPIRAAHMEKRGFRLVERSYLLEVGRA